MKCRHTIAYSHPAVQLARMGELANPTPSATSNPQLWITYSLVNFMKFDCFLPLLNSILHALVSIWGWKNKHHCHCCFEIQHSCKVPTDNPTVVTWEGHVLLHRWVSWSEEEIRLSTHLQSPGSAWQGVWRGCCLQRRLHLTACFGTWYLCTDGWITAAVQVDLCHP